MFSELHLILGILVKMLYALFDAWSLISKEKDPGPKWLADNNIKTLTYWAQLNGPECMTVLKKVSELEKIIPKSLKKYTEAMKLFKIVIDKSFGQLLVEGWKKSIEDFKNSYKKLGLSNIPKCHSLFSHIVVFCERKGRGKYGLGFFR